MTQEFKVGDRVEYVGNNGIWRTCCQGVVVGRSKLDDVAVVFDGCSHLNCCKRKDYGASYCDGVHEKHLRHATERCAHNHQLAPGSGAVQVATFAVYNAPEIEQIVVEGKRLTDAVKRTMRSVPLCSQSGEPVSIVPHVDRSQGDEMLVATLHCEACHG